MIGLEPIEQSRFYSLLNGDEVTQWVNHASLGAIEILNPQRILDSQLDTSQTEPLQAASDTNSNRKIDDKTSTKNPGIGLNLDSVSLVLPQEMIRSVNAKLAIQNVRSKPFKKAIAAFDLLKISTPSTNPSIDSSIRRAATIQLNNGQSVIFMAQEVYEPNTEQPWLPTPVLPRPLSQMIQGIRINNHHCELLLDPLFMSKMSEQELSNLYETTFCGWHNSY
jgi:hypothetical protein